MEYSNVAAHFKSGDRRNSSNHRPISIPPTLSKIKESIIHTQYYEYLDSNNIISSKENGFRPKLSTTAALSALADEVLLKMEAGELCAATLRSSI